MKRLTIFAYYNSGSQLNKSTSYLLQELKSVSERIIIVVNGSIQDEVKKELSMITNEIHYRENIGYDAGAYSEIILDYLKIHEITGYDELILCNDTFWGPFVSFSSVFEAMEGKECDFWGFHKYENEIFPFIPSYFLVFKNALVKGEVITRFFESVAEYLKTNNVLDIYACFETYIYIWLEKAGYRSAVYADTQNISFYDTPYWAVKQGLPLIKKRSGTDHFDPIQVKASIEYVKKYTDYSADIIINELDCEKRNRILQDSNEITDDSNIPCKYSPVPTIKADELKSFIYDSAGRVAIYGEGIFGRRLFFVWKEIISDFQGFVVSDNVEIKEDRVFDYPVRNLKDISKDIAIIVSLDKTNLEQVVRNLGDRKIITLYDTPLRSFAGGH